MGGRAIPCTLRSWRDAKSQMVLTGHRKFRIAVLLSAASVLIILGFWVIVNAGLLDVQPQDTRGRAAARHRVRGCFGSAPSSGLASGGRRRDLPSPRSSARICRGSPSHAPRQPTGGLVPAVIRR